MSRHRTLMQAHIRDVMSDHVFTVEPDTSLVDVAREMAAHGIGAVPVVENGGILVGIVSGTDLVNLLHDRTKLEGKSAREVMIAPAIATDEFATVDEAIGVMRNASIRHLPVTREGRIVGVVTQGDLIRHLVRQYPAPEVA